LPILKPAKRHKTQELYKYVKIRYKTQELYKYIKIRHKKRNKNSAVGKAVKKKY